MFRYSAFIALSLVTALASAAHAGTTYSWNTGSNGKWNDAANWLPNTGFPAAADDVDTPTQVGGLLFNIAAPQVTNWNFNASTTWNAIGQNGAGGSTLTISGNLTKSGTGSMIFRGNTSNPLSMITGPVSVTGGTLTFGGGSGSFLNSLSIASASVGTGSTLSLTVGSTSGTAAIAGDLTLIGTGTVNIRADGTSADSGTLEVGSLTSASSTAVVGVNGNNSHPDTAALSLKNASGSATYAGTLVNGGTTTNVLSVTKSGAGSQTLSGNLNTYSGGTTISNGKLIITNNSTSSATGTGAVGITGATATLAGTGTILGASALVTVDSGGHLAPAVNASGAGNNFGVAGALNLGLLDGGLTLNDANLDFDLASTAAGLNDLITTSGILTLGTLDFNFNRLSGALETGTPYSLITGASSVSGFDPANISTFGNGSYVPTYNLSSNNLTVTFAAPVPEPGALSLLAVGSVGLLLRRRRSDRHKGINQSHA